MATIRTSLALVITASFLGGCYGNIDSFSKRAAALSCKRTKECDGQVFEDQYKGDMGRCKDDVEDAYHDQFDPLIDDQGCDYDPKEGRKCIHTANKLKKDCSDDADQDIADDCAEVLDCPGD